MSENKKHKQDLWSASLLVEAFGHNVRELRQECNRLASKSIAMFTLLLIGLIVALLVRFWIA